MSSYSKNESGLDAKGKFGGAAPATAQEAAVAFEALQPFMSWTQRRMVAELMTGDEKQFFFDKMVELAGVVASMPQTYESEGKGMEAIAYLHYFVGRSDFYVSEKDSLDPQSQAFGLSCAGYESELGYIAIDEITTHGAELDFFFTPATLSDLATRRDQVQA